MINVKFNNGIEMPILGLGLYKITDKKEVENAVKWAIEAGYRKFDTAQFYDNEKELGEAIRKTGIKREELLIASHIKPWSKSNNNERLDIDNVLLLCPQHDILFDKGFISFSDEGNIIISSILNDDEFPSLNLSGNLRINVNEKQKKYLEYHRENILRK